MLKTISPLISPDLLKVLAEMGHGDEIIFSDAHFPAHSMGPQVIRADGLRVSDLLQAIIPLFELDSYAPPLVMMAAVEGDALDPQVETRYREALRPRALPGYRPHRPLCLLRAGAKSLCDRYHR
jgi:L-fucose mutarotase